MQKMSALVQEITVGLYFIKIMNDVHWTQIVLAKFENVKSVLFKGNQYFLKLCSTAFCDETATPLQHLQHQPPSHETGGGGGGAGEEGGGGP